MNLIEKIILEKQVKKDLQSFREAQEKIKNVNAELQILIDILGWGIGLLVLLLMYLCYFL